MKIGPKDSKYLASFLPSGFENIPNLAPSKAILTPSNNKIIIFISY